MIREIIDGTTNPTSWPYITGTDIQETYYNGYTIETNMNTLLSSSAQGRLITTAHISQSTSKGGSLGTGAWTGYVASGQLLNSSRTYVGGSNQCGHIVAPYRSGNLGAYPCFLYYFKYSAGGTNYCTVVHFGATPGSAYDGNSWVDTDLYAPCVIIGSSSISRYLSESSSFRMSSYDCIYADGSAYFNFYTRLRSYNAYQPHVNGFMCGTCQIYYGSNSCSCPVIIGLCEGY